MELIVKYDRNLNIRKGFVYEGTFQSSVSIPVGVIHLDTKEIIYFPSISACARYFEVAHNTIWIKLKTKGVLRH